MSAPEERQHAERLFARPCTFALGVASLAALPDEDRAEVCFGGRSNAGKSTLLNALLGRRALARSSSQPGCTRQLNFFDLDGSIWLVDLPGYGYARASRSEARRWQKLMSLYVSGRRGLRRAYVLIDARRGVGSADHEFMARLDSAGVSHRCVLTKIDKLPTAGRDSLPDRVAADLARHPAAHPQPLATSARLRNGLEELRDDIADVTC